MFKGALTPRKPAWESAICSPRLLIRTTTTTTATTTTTTATAAAATTTTTTTTTLFVPITATAELRSSA